MAAKTKNRLSDLDILGKLVQKSKESVGWYDSRLSRERQRVLDYMNGKRPGRQHSGSSSYVSTDVYDSVQMMKSQIIEVFAGGDNIVEFDPDQDMGIDECRIATQYASYVFFRQNPGWRIIHDVAHDGLTSRVGVVKTYWEELHDYEEETFNNLDIMTAHGLAAQEEVSDFDADIDDPDSPFPTYSGTLKRKIDKSQVRVDVLPPEEFLIEPRAISIDRATYKAHRTLKTKAELLQMGLDKAKVQQVHYDDAKGLDLSPEVLARNAPVESLQALNNPMQPETEQVMLYEEYVKLDLHGGKGVRLYKAIRAGDVLFDVEEIDRHPFREFVPLPIPHLFHGENYATRVIPFQNARTVLVRSVLDHAAITTNPRWAVVKGGLLNPREMIDNRLGGLVNVARPDSVAALQVPNLNPFVFEINKQLAEDREQSTGISSLSQGLNKDAISKQNAQGLVDNLVQLSGQRQKVICRNFAYNFFAPLMMDIIRLVIMHEKRKKVIEVAGNWVNVDPQQWTERRGVTVAMHLGYAEKDMFAQKIQAAYKGMAEDPSIAHMFLPQNRYEMLIDGMKAGGLVKATRYISNPQTVPPPQPDPLKTQEIAIKKEAADAQMLTAQAAMEKDKRLNMVDQRKLSQQDERLHLDAIREDREQDRKDLDVAARVHVAQRQLQMEEHMAPAQMKALVNPRP